MSQPSPSPDSLSPWEKIGIWALLALVIAFGVVVEWRSDFMHNKHTDLGVYLRGAYAIRTGGNLYAATARGWHYNYPPLLAMLLSPLGIPPDGVHAWHVPFAISVAIFYVGSILCLALATQILATAIEERSPEPAVRLQAAGGHRWWALRLWPILVCLTAIGSSLSRSQVNLLLLLTLVLSAAAMVRQQRWRAGFWLGAAICLKVMPLFLLIVPLRRKDWRFLAGAGLSVIALELLAPMLFVGPAKAIDYNVSLVRVLLKPGAVKAGKADRFKELVGTADNQSILAAFRNDFSGAKPGDKTATPILAAYLLAAAAMTLIVIVPVSGRGGLKPIYTLRDLYAFAILIMVMILSSPVCHLHYFCLVVPLIMVLSDIVWRRHDRRLDNWFVVGMLIYIILNTLPRLPTFYWMRPIGVVTFTHLALFVPAVYLLNRMRQAEGGWA